MENKTSSGFHSAKTIIISSSCQINLRQHPPNHLVRGLFLWQAQLSGTPNRIVCHSKSASAFKCSQNLFLQVFTFLICFHLFPSVCWGLITETAGYVVTMGMHVWCVRVCIVMTIYYVLEFSTALCPQSLYYLGQGAQDGHLDFHTAPNSEKSILYSVAHIYAVPCAPPPPPPSNYPPFSLFDYVLLVFTMCIAIVKHIALLIVDILYPPPPNKVWSSADLDFRVNSLEAFAQVTLEVEGRGEDGVQQVKVFAKSNFPVSCLWLLVPAENIPHV